MVGDARTYDMYAVVGCGECGALWIVEGRPERTTCPRCRTSKAHASRRKFVTTDDRDHAREVRTSMLADRAGQGEAFGDLDAAAEMADRAEEPVVTDEEYLDGANVDATAATAAGERASSSGRSVSRLERVSAALEELDEPTADDVAAYCEEHGVSGTYAREALERLARRGAVSESGGVYRRL